MDRKTVTLYRGDTGDNLDDIREESGELRRDYPIYFTESKDAAVEEYAPEKLDDSKPYLVEIEAPFDSFVYLNHKQSKKVEINPETLDLKPEKLYFMQPFEGNAEFASVRIPEEWIESIEEL